MYMEIFFGARTCHVNISAPKKIYATNVQQESANANISASSKTIFKFFMCKN